MRTFLCAEIRGDISCELMGRNNEVFLASQSSVTATLELDGSDGHNEVDNE